jgi:hypothetical protein
VGCFCLLSGGGSSLLPLAAATVRFRVPLLLRGLLPPLPLLLLLLLPLLLSSPSAAACFFGTPLRFLPASWIADTVLAAYSGSCHSRLASAERLAKYSSSSS